MNYYTHFNELIRPWLSSFLTNFELFSIWFLLIANSSYAIILIFGFLNARKKHVESIIELHDKKSISNVLKPISLIVPCYNEQESIIDSIQSMRSLDYPEYEIVIVNDGSKDDSLHRLIVCYGFKKVDIRIPDILKHQEVRGIYLSKDNPNLILIDKENGGKADALNAGINMSQYPLVCCVDSDGIIESKGLMQMALPFFERPEDCVATGGVIRVVNDLKVKDGQVIDTKLNWSFIQNIQIVEYLRAFLVGRLGWDFINCNTIISGAFGLFKKQAVLNVGGYGHNTIGEDLELLLRIEGYYLKNNLPYSVHFLPDPICWTEVPTDLKTLGNQRSRWQQGLFESLMLSRHMFFKPWAGRIGNVALPYLFFFELLSAPLELFSYIIAILGLTTGIISPNIAITYLLISIIYGWILTFGAIVIEEFTFNKYQKPSDFFKLLLGCLLEQLGYRQLHLFWRVRGMWRHLMGTQVWGEMKRKGNFNS